MASQSGPARSPAVVDVVRRVPHLVLAGVLLAGVVLAGLAGALAGADRASAVESMSRPSVVQAGDRGELLLVLDSSGSMKEPDASGSTKMAAAKEAMGSVIDQLPDGAPVGLRVYGAKVFDRSDPGACTDSQLVVPVGPADKPALEAAVARYRPYGETPIAYSLRQAAKDLGSTGRRTIVLVSDGEETCDPDPCAVARALHDNGIDLKIDVVGLHVDAAAKRQLTCIADAGGGTYYNVGDADDLSASLDQTTLRAFRDYVVSGTPVKGGPQPGRAPRIGMGQYSDTLAPASEETGRVKYYLLERTPGATVHAAVTMRPAKRTGGAAEAGEELTLTLLTPEGDEECTNGHGTAFEWSTARDFLNASVFHGPQGNTAGSQYLPEECGRGDRLLLKVARGDATGGTSDADDPFELVVSEEPPLSGGLGDLPARVEEADIAHAAVPATADRGKADGGGGFTDATTLTPGTWSGTLQPGEQLFYRVRADWGQAPAVTFRLLANPTLERQVSGNGCGSSVSMRAYGPDRAEVFLPGGTDGNLTGTTRCYSKSDVLHATLPPVRFRNRESGAPETVRPVSLAGYYYFAIQQNPDDRGRRLQEPVQVSVAVTGDRSGVPSYRAPEPAATTSEPSKGDRPTEPRPESEPAAGAADGPAEARGSVIPVVAVTASGIAILAGVAVLVVVLVRRPRRAYGPGSQPGAPPGPPRW